MTAYIEVLTEGVSDVPVLHELLARHCGLTPGQHFRIHPHQGRGRLPGNLLAAPNPRHHGLLDQLPAKLRGMAWLPPSALVLVLIDADRDEPQALVQSLQHMLAQLPRRPAQVLFCLAVEETESWFLADATAIGAAFPHARLHLLQGIAPDAVIGAWECLARVLSRRADGITGVHKLDWARKIAPHLNFATTPSPSLQTLVQGMHHYLNRPTASTA